MAGGHGGGKDKGPLAGGRGKGSPTKNTKPQRGERNFDRMNRIYRNKLSVTLIHGGNVDEEEMMRYCKAGTVL
jgi:hypothetical protein